MPEAARFSSAKGLAWPTWGWMEEFSAAVPLSQPLLSSVPHPWAFTILLAPRGAPRAVCGTGGTEPGVPKLL